MRAHWALQRHGFGAGAWRPRHEGWGGGRRWDRGDFRAALRSEDQLPFFTEMKEAEIDCMVQVVDVYRGEDESNKMKIEAKNGLENFRFTLRNQLR